jgi:hypothetical protein
MPSWNSQGQSDLDVDLYQRGDEGNIVFIFLRSKPPFERKNRKTKD